MLTSFSAWAPMSFCLRITQRPNDKEYSPNKQFIFSVIDLDKAEKYPLNFVCKLPRLRADCKAENVFVKKFGSTSYDLAQILLQKALKQEKTPEVRDEIRKRLKLLEPKPVVEKNCMKCGKTFQATPRQAFRLKHCPECLRERALERGQIFPDFFSGIKE